MKQIIIKVENGFIPSGKEAECLKKYIYSLNQSKGNFKYQFFGNGIIAKIMKVSFTIN